MVKKQSEKAKQVHCLRTHHLVKKLIYEIEKKRSLQGASQSKIINYLEIDEILNRSQNSSLTCSCREIIRILLQITNLKKWLGLLLSEQETVFCKRLIIIPEPFRQIKGEFQDLIFDLELKVLSAANQVRCSALSTIEKKKRLEKVGKVEPKLRMRLK